MHGQRLPPSTRAAYRSRGASTIRQRKYPTPAQSEALLSFRPEPCRGRRRSGEIRPRRERASGLWPDPFGRRRAGSSTPRCSARDDRRRRGCHTGRRGGRRGESSFAPAITRRGVHLMFVGTPSRGSQSTLSFRPKRSGVEESGCERAIALSSARFLRAGFALSRNDIRHALRDDSPLSWPPQEPTYKHAVHPPTWARDEMR